MQAKQLKGSIMLILTAMIWGAAFVAQDVGMDHVGPFTFNALRMTLGAIALAPVILVFDLGKRKQMRAAGEAGRVFGFTRQELVGGVLCGVILFAASTFQQIGISLYSDADAAAGKSGFITALYIVIVPVMGLFLRKKSGVSVWISVAVATVGMYLLCVKSGFVIDRADGLLLLCALAFSFHILVIDYYSPRVNGIKLSAVQFLTAGVLSAPFMLVTEQPSFSGISQAAVPILYAGIFSCSVAYTMQVVAQKYTKPAVASVILSMESVFAAVTGALFGERLSGREMIGCLLVFAAVLLAQVNPETFSHRGKKAKA